MRTKRFLLLLFPLAIASPLLARDEGGDGDSIPDYRELLREGYGPPRREFFPYLNANEQIVPMPTQAYYGKGYTIYYGFTQVRVHPWETSMIYAFGYPADFYRRIMPESITDVNLDHYAISVLDNKAYPEHRGNAITTVRPTAAGAAASPPAGGSTALPSR